MAEKKNKISSVVEKIKEASKKLVLEQVVAILPSISKNNFIRILSLYEKISSGESKKVIASLKSTFKDSIAGDLIVRGIRNINARGRKKIAIDLIADGMIMRDKKRREEEAKGGFVPFTVLFSPTMRCNLRCKGCYAGNYSQTDDLPYEVVDRMVTEAEDMGVAFMTVLGGEPFMWEPIFKLLEEHPHMYFQIYTNSTMLNKERVKRLKKLGNAALMLSIEGFEKETDERRHPGIYQKVIAAMDLLHKEKIPFGYSVAVTRENEPVVTSDEFIDLMIEKGAIIGWMFLYMPVGMDPDLSLMPTPEQRLHMLEFNKRIRQNKPILVIDFWNDAPFVGGCIAGKYYVHITSQGWAEPCIFSHVAQDNIKEKSLREIMRSELFSELRKRQPYHENLYLPCMWIDSPEVSRDIHAKLKLHLTHPGADDVLKKPHLVEGMDKYSKRVKELYEKEWRKEKEALDEKGGISDRLMKKLGND